MAAEGFLQDDQFDKARAAIDQALQDNPADGRAVLTKARIVKRQAMKSVPPDREKLQQALDLTNQAIALLPGHSEPIYNKACYQALLGIGTDEVLNNLKRAFDLAPALRVVAQRDIDLESLRDNADFKKLTVQNDPAVS